MTGSRTRRIAAALGALLAVAAVSFVLFAPAAAERQFNRRTGEPLPDLSNEARTLHGDLMVADLHADSLLWNRDLTKRSRHGHVDLPRLAQGGVGIQVFSTVIKTPRGMNYERNTAATDALRPLLVAQLWPPATWTRLEARAHHQARRLHRLARRSNGRLEVVTTLDGLDRFLSARGHDGRTVAGLLAIEGLHALEGDLQAVDRLAAAGFRMMGLAHFFDNEVAGSAHGVDRGGLTPFGRDVLRRLEALGIVVDLAHASPAAFEEVLDAATRPVVVSHTGVQATCPGTRNLSDHVIRRIAAHGGLIGIGYWEGAVCGTAPADVARAIRHIVELVGARHAALGSDFDGAVEVAFDTSELAVVTEALLRAGLTASQIRAVMGGNVVDLFRRMLPAEADPQ